MYQQQFATLRRAQGLNLFLPGRTALKVFPVTGICLLSLKISDFGFVRFWDIGFASRVALGLNDSFLPWRSSRLQSFALQQVHSPLLEHFRYGLRLTTRRHALYAKSAGMRYHPISNP